MPIFDPARLQPAVLEKLIMVCGEDSVSTREPDRICYARDMWPGSLIRQRSGALDHPPDVIVWPHNAEQVAGVVRVAAEADMPVIAFGAGSGVCGGTLPVQGGILVDLKRLKRILQIQPTDSLLQVEAGALGENLERELNRRGWTLGHFPSSIYCSTVGGWIAARSAGQCSSRYGKIEDLVRSLTYVDATGKIVSTPFDPPGYGAWSLAPLLVGSEGTLGIVVSATLVLRPLATERWYCAFKFPGVAEGLDAMRIIMRRGLRPSVVRLYDEFDTLMAKTGPQEADLQDSVLRGLGKKMSGSLTGVLRLSLRGALRAPGLLNRLADLLPGGCLLVVVQEGQQDEREITARAIKSVCKSRAGVDLGKGPALHWWRHRYSVSYKQSAIFMAGAFVDTMEVATTWDRLMPLYVAVRKAVSPLAFIMAHFSHAYREGCSVYFTFAAAARDDAATTGLYDRIWDAAQAAVLAEGGVVSHHHGVGMSKQRFMVEQLADARVLSNMVKKAFDPRRMFNPGKLGQGPKES